MSLSENQVAKILETALSSGGDFAELFIENKDELQIKYEDESVKRLTTTRIKGAGIYLLSGTRSVYVYTNDLSLDKIMNTAKLAAELLNQKNSVFNRNILFEYRKSNNPNKFIIYPSSVEHKDKINILREISLAAKSVDSRIVQMAVTYFDTDQNISIYNSEGLFTWDRRISSRVRLNATISDGANYYDDWDDFTRPQGFEAFNNKSDYITFAKEFIKGLASSTEGISLQSCNVPVVFEAGACGTFWHETCGHQLEASAIASNNSDFVGMIGKKVASDKVTLIDDGSIPGLYGTSGIDDEGHPTQKNILIENGILKGYLVDRLGGRLLNMSSTGNGRRQSYSYAPTSRMTNTYLAAGNDDENEMIKSIDKGVFVKRLGGGTGGREFSLAVKEGYLIEKGEITKRLKGLTLNGRGIDLIKRVDRVGKKLENEGGSFCGASSGLCPVTSFQPRMRISNMFVGGK